MIIAQSEDEVLIVLEPGNIDEMAIGKPFSMTLPEGVTKIMIGYTPDSNWVSRQVRNGKNLIQALIDSLSRKEIHRNPYAPDRWRDN